MTLVTATDNVGYTVDILITSTLIAGVGLIQQLLLVGARVGVCNKLIAIDVARRQRLAQVGFFVKLTLIDFVAHAFAGLESRFIAHFIVAPASQKKHRISYQQAVFDLHHLTPPTHQEPQDYSIGSKPSMTASRKEKAPQENPGGL